MDDLVDPDTSLHPENLAHNERTLHYIRSTIASISGAVAGILGLTSYLGFLFYLLTSIWAACVLAICNTALKPRMYFKNGVIETATQGLINNALSYTLFWTLFYGLVHVYERTQ
ncbi:MAG: ER membrane complex subunit 6 [Cyphobasidiales sp. Tagirdzhanova-0007]|nr:MAG: ER membrane complex subunit 6 [Cyphobasidiales sp. Tagirdzhanova-0007]